MECVPHALIIISLLFFFFFVLLVGSKTKSIQNEFCGLDLKNSYRLPCTHSRRHVLAHQCSLSGFEQIFRNWILMRVQGQEERVYMQTCHKYVRVGVYICIYIWDKTCYMAYTTDLNGERILCLTRSRRTRLKHRDILISMYSGSTHLNPWPPVGNVDFSETLREQQSTRLLWPSRCHVPRLPPGTAPAGPV